MHSDLDFKLIKPDPSLSDFVYGFSSLQHLSGYHDGVIIPNGRIDLMFSKTTSHQLQVALIGLETKPKLLPKHNIAGFFSISFNPLGVEYILQQSIATFVDGGILLPSDFWGYDINDLDDFDSFCSKSVQKIKSLIPPAIDERKRKLFELIFSTNGEIAVQEIAERVYWSQRQISRYFNQQFGLSLKSYCSILRFQASLSHIKAGELFPQLNFTDQSHFIKEIKRLSGVSPKELFKNQNDRFLQFLAVDPE